MAIDLSKLSPKELDEIIANAERQKAESAKVYREKTKAKIEDILSKDGFTIQDIYPRLFGKGKVKSVSAVAPKYRNPANPEQTWSGRGKRPLWINEALKGGKKIESMAIDAVAVAKKTATQKAPAKKAAAKK